MPTIIGAALKLPEGFELLGVVNTAKYLVKAPDGSQIEMLVDVKAFDSKEFFESIEKFKEQVTQP